MSSHRSHHWTANHTLHHWTANHTLHHWTADHTSHCRTVVSLFCYHMQSIAELFITYIPVAQTAMTRKVSLNCYHPYSIETCDHTPCFAELESYACYRSTPITNIILVSLNLYRYDSLSIAKLAAPIPHCWTAIVHLVSDLASLSTTLSSYCHGIIKHRRNIDCIAELTSYTSHRLFAITRILVVSLNCYHTHCIVGLPSQTQASTEFWLQAFHYWAEILRKALLNRCQKYRWTVNKFIPASELLSHEWHRWFGVKRIAALNCYHMRGIAELEQLLPRWPATCTGIMCMASLNWYHSRSLTGLLSYVWHC